MNLAGKKIGLLLGDGFDHGAVRQIVSILKQMEALKILVLSKNAPVHSDEKKPYKVDFVLSKATVKDIDALIIPEGDSVNRLCYEDSAITLILEMNDKEKPIGSTGNGVNVFASAGILSGRRVTGNIQDSLEAIEKSQAVYTDQDLVVDRNLVTAKNNDSLEHFFKAITFLLEPAATIG